MSMGEDLKNRRKLWSPFSGTAEAEEGTLGLAEPGRSLRPIRLICRPVTCVMASSL